MSGDYTHKTSLSTLYPPSGCCMSSRITPKQTGTGLNPTKYFRRGPRKNVQTRTYLSELNICAPKPRERGPRLDPVPVGFNAFLVWIGGGTILPCQGREFYFTLSTKHLRARRGKSKTHAFACVLGRPPEYYKGLRNQHRMGKFAFGACTV